MERYQQGVFPDDKFAYIAVRQFESENPEIDHQLYNTLLLSAFHLERGDLEPEKEQIIRNFMTAMIGFGKQYE